MSLSRTFVRRFGLWGLVGVTIIFLTALYTFVTPKLYRPYYDRVCPKTPVNGSPVNAERLIEKFDLTVFKNDVEPWRDINFVYKWNGQIRVDAREIPKQHFEHLTQLLTQLSCLTGLDIRTDDLGPRLPPNFEINVIPPKYIDLIAKEIKLPNADAEWLRQNFDCIGQLKYEEYREVIRVYSANVIIRNDLSDLKIRRCLVEEITQSLGLMADSEIIEESVFRNGRPDLDYLPLNDKILVRALYDRRIKPGMAREEAMKVAAEIIPELVAAVKRDGVEALYQHQ